MITVSMRVRCAAVVAALALAATACGSGGGTPGAQESPSAKDGPATTPATTPATSPAEVETFDRKHTDIEVEDGSRFALALDEVPGTGKAWIIDDPRFDEAVITAEGSEYTPEGATNEGSGGTRSLTFRAKSPGSTTIELLYCYRCGTEYEETDDATELTFTVTVRAEDES